MDQDVHGTAWTRSRVEADLIAAFRAMPGLPVYTVGSRFKVSGDGVALEALSWAAYLTDDEEGRKYLWAWARCRGTRASFSELVNGNGWKRPTAEAGRRRAAETIAARLRSTTSTPLDSEKTGEGGCAPDARDTILAFI